MKAVVYRRYGGPEVLEYTDVPDPKLSQTSVLVRVRAAALNPADYMLQAGLGESHTDAWFPMIPGWDVAGVVERVGAGVSEFAPGDEVIGFMLQLAHCLSKPARNPPICRRSTGTPEQKARRAHRSTFTQGRRSYPIIVSVIISLIIWQFEVSN